MSFESSPPRSPVLDLNVSIGSVRGSPSRHVRGFSLISLGARSTDKKLDKSFECKYGYDILLHIVSHSDILLKIETKTSAHIAKPKPEVFQSVCEKIVESLLQNLTKGQLLQPLSDASGELVTGFELGKASFTDDSWNKYELRSEDAVDRSELPRICGVHFPKLAPYLLPKWLDALSSSKAEKIFYCVCATTAVGESSTSTVAAGNLVKVLVEHIFRYASVSVKVLASDESCDLMRYDDNVKFVMHSVLPRLESHRRALAEYSFRNKESNWQDKLTLVLSLADAVPARVSAVTAALREYRPSTLHIFNVSNVRGKNQIRRKEVQLHKFSKMEMLPSQPISELDNGTRKIVENMQSYIRRFEVAVHQDNSDLPSFWLRKSKKAVLSVLAVDVPQISEGCTTPKRGANDEIVTETEYFYGVNMEVSMPTGSLCAERNAIGTALATHPGLHRRYMKAIAVYSADMNHSLGNNPIYPCGACTEWLKKIAEVNPDFKLLTFVSKDCEDVIVQSIFTLTSTPEAGDTAEPERRHSHSQSSPSEAWR